jgi:hypothetical protein
VSIAPVPGMPGIKALRTASWRRVFREGSLLADLAGGKVIDGAKSRDPTNSPTTVLQPGTLMGKITASGKYAPSILGVTTVAYTSGGTTLTVAAATAAELVRRVGTSGNFNTVGPPGAAGTVATINTAFSAVNTGTGAITVTSLGANMVVGSLIMPQDGSQNALTLIEDGYGIWVQDNDGLDIDVPFNRMPIAGVIDDTQIVNWPADVSTQAFLRALLSTASGGKFVFGGVF